MNKKILGWILLNALSFTIALLWLLGNHEWAGNIYKFLVGYLCVCCLAYFNEDFRKKAKTIGRSVNKYFAFVASLGEALLMAGFSHFWLAAGVMFIAAMEAYAFDSEE